MHLLPLHSKKSQGLYPWTKSILNICTIFVLTLNCQESLSTSKQTPAHQKWLVKESCTEQPHQPVFFRSISALMANSIGVGNKLVLVFCLKKSKHKQKKQNCLKKEPWPTSELNSNCFYGAADLGSLWWPGQRWCGECPTKAHTVVHTDSFSNCEKGLQQPDAWALLRFLLWNPAAYKHLLLVALSKQAL